MCERRMCECCINERHPSNAFESTTSCRAWSKSPVDDKRNCLVLLFDKLNSPIWKDRIMSTQSYYKDRLGFDPREALYESSGGSNGGSTTIKSGSRRVVQQHHYSSSTTQQHSNGSSPAGGGGYYSNSPAKKLKHSVYSSSNTAISSGSYVSGSPGANIGANIAAINSNSNNQGDGYEDALTQFKGTMSIWDYFVENWDASGTIQTQLRYYAWVCVYVCSNTSTPEFASNSMI